MDDNDMEMEMGTPPPVTRALEIDIGDQEVITIDLDALDQSTDDVINVLQDARCKVTTWTQLASEYWRRGWLDSAQRIAHAALEFFKSIRDAQSLSSVYLLMAGIQMDSARAAPKMKLESPQLDKLGNETLKEVYLSEATALMNYASGAAKSELFFLTRGIHQLSKHSTINDALVTFEGILQGTPTNIVALHGKARIMYMQRKYREALQLYQRILRLSPNAQPDPRIGIGLCFWQLDDRSKAKKAWERSLELHPNHWVPQLLLGLESLNASKDSQRTEEQRHHAYTVGSKHIERAFHINQKNGATANCLSEYFIRRGEARKALKLAERSIQYADSITILSEGHLRAGRVAHLEGRYDDAITHYTNAKNLPLASIGIAQCHIKRGETAAAIHVLDTLLNGPETQQPKEAMIMLASLRAFERPALSSAELAQDKAKARELLERVKRHTSQANGTKSNGISAVNNRKPAWMNDLEMHVEIGRLWEREDTAKALLAYQDARRISEQSVAGADPRIINNIAVLGHLSGKIAEARALYEEALGILANKWANHENMDGMSTTILYNLARVYEDQDETALAKDAYDKLLGRHPEYVDAKVRLAHMLLASNKPNEAHTILKQAIETQQTNMNLRAYYTHFLTQSNLLQAALKIVHATLNINKNDLYGTVASGWLHYQLGREARPNNEETMRDRRHKLLYAAEFYERALNLDPSCSVAAQGLAILIAEDAIGMMALKPGAGLEDHETRLANTSDALEYFARIREVMADGSVYTNMGHCYYMRDEYERAIESYETGLQKFYNGQNTSVMMCLSRAWYAKATRDQSFVAMKTALHLAQTAQMLSPGDKSIKYNIAVIEQRAAEMVFSLPVSKRTLEELQEALDLATNAQRFLFELSEDTSKGGLPYDKDMASQRHRYLGSLLRKGTEQISQQQEYEKEHHAKLEAARAFRMAEKAAAEAKEKARLEELQREAAALAEERRKAREEAALWAAQHKDDSSDEDKPKRKKKGKAAGDDLFDDDDEAATEPRKEPKEKKERKPRITARKRKGKDAQTGDEGLSSGEDAEKTERPRKRLTKKRVVNDDEEEEVDQRARKKFKTSDLIEDSDEELERIDRIEAERLRLSKAVISDDAGEDTNMS